MPVPTQAERYVALFDSIDWSARRE